MRIGMNVWPGYEPLFLAREAGLLREDNYRLVEFSNSSGVGRAFRNGTLEAACLTLDEVLYTMQDGMDPVLLLVLDESRGADVVLARPEITSLAALKGKRIAVEVSAVETYLLTRALQNAGLTLADVTPVRLPIEKHRAALVEGTVDAVVTFEPARTEILALRAVELFNSAHIPGEIVDVLVVRRDYLQQNPKRIDALRQAWFAVLKRMRDTPHDSARIMAMRERVTPEQFEASLLGVYFPDEAECRTLLTGEPPLLLKSAEKLKTVMRDAHLLERDFPLSPLFTLPDAGRPRR